ncbi:MAG: T9SS type A sorting domain-containing protein [Saprospiraceae bacterium]
MKSPVFFFMLLLGNLQLAAQCLSIASCPASPVTLCDVSANEADLWNNAGFYDAVTGSHDLAEMPVDLSIQATESCGGGDVLVSYVLFLDLSGDGTRETAVSSGALSAFDIVNYENAANPNYTGGQPLHFDQRPVPVDQKYRFALEKTYQNGLVTMGLRWVTPAAPTTYLQPQLPAGTHRIEWRFEEGTEVKTCGYNFTIKDCKSPTVVCLSGLSVNIMPTQMIQLWATDFLQYAQDNYTPAAQLKYGIRRSGTGTGFPVNGQGLPVTNVIFTCADFGTQPVELWVIDQAGNADFCETYVIVQDNNGNCEGNPTLLSACAKSYCTGTGISDVTFEFSGSSNAIPPFSMFIPGSGNNGCANFPSVPISSNVTITPSKDTNPLNGVSTYDLVLISRHILGLEPLGSPYKMIAADVNKSGSITTFDIVELRKLILGYYQELPNNTSWRFVDQAFVFPNQNNPFQTVFPENKTLINIQQNMLALNFVGIKIGDVNCNAIANVTGQNPEEEALVIPDLHLQANEVVEVPVRFAQAKGYYGFQFGLHFDPALVEVLEVEPVLGSLDNFGVFADQVRVSWSAAESVLSLPDEPVFLLRLRALAPLQLAEVLSLDNALRAEAYPEQEDRVDLRLQFEPNEATASGTAPGIFAPQPNPTTAGVRIPLRLEQPETLSVELFDASGRLRYRQEQPGSAGAQWLEVPATAFPQAGMYCWRVQAGATVQSGKIVRQ